MIDYNKLLINPLLLLLLITTEVSATNRGQLEVSSFGQFCFKLQ